MNRVRGACAAALLSFLPCARPQVIEFESNGLRYQTLTRSGVTVMFAAMLHNLHEFSIIQVAVSNGSPSPYTIRPEDFTYVRNDGVVLRASPARNVILMLNQKGSANDVIRLVTNYESSIYGNGKMKSTNGYEQRRQAAMAMGSVKLKAAAAASALAMVQTKLAPGESTDGAVFFPTEGKGLGPGHLVIRTTTDTFDFKSE